MNPIMTFFPVDNGDMTLIQLRSGRTILIDCNIRQLDDGVRDVATDLLDRLRRDGEGRPFVDAMMLTHPDQDHCRGLSEHFHLGPISDYETPEEGETGKIIIRELWSSPMVFRRKRAGETWCEDALAWETEAKRRAKPFKREGAAVDGNRIQLMGEDESNDKMTGLGTVVVKAGQNIEKICGEKDGTFSGFLIAPKGKGSAEEEERRSKNHSSVIVRFKLGTGAKADAGKYLCGGDAHVEIWERIWDDHGAQAHRLAYHILGAPHHCSWHSLSSESWSDTNGTAKASKNAKLALGQALSGAVVISSSKEVTDDKDDPPCIGAKREYEEIVSSVEGEFLNTATHRKNGEACPMEFEITVNGPVTQPPGSKIGVDRAAKLTDASTLRKTILVSQKQRSFA